MSKRALWLAVWLLCWLALPAAAAEVDAQVTDAQGRPVSDAVLTLVPDVAATAPAPAVASKSYFIDQKHETFIPYVQIMRPGDKVIFRNSDTTRHQVYSFSPIKQFEFVLRSGQVSPALTIDKGGIVAIGCNIHDDMIAYLFVTAAPAVGRSDAAGKVALDHLAPGHYTAQLWHPLLHPGQPPLSEPVVLGSDTDVRQLVFKLSLIPDPRGVMDHSLMDH